MTTPTTPKLPEPATGAMKVGWKCGNEFAPYHHQASHINPDHRDGWNACYRAAQPTIQALAGEVERLRAALSQIERWELPATGKFWDKEKTDPASYGAIYGSNGERDYIRAVARAALDASRAVATQEAK